MTVVLNPMLALGSWGDLGEPMLGPKGQRLTKPEQMPQCQEEAEGCQI